MMKITLGYREMQPEGIKDIAYGTIEQTPDGFTLLGDVDKLRQILEQAKRELPAQRQVRLARQMGPFSDEVVLRYLLKSFGGMKSWCEIGDEATKGVFRELTAAYTAWDTAWSQTIHTSGVRGLPLLFGLPGDAESLQGYEQRYTDRLTPEQRSAFARYVAAFRAWLEVSS